MDNQLRKAQTIWNKAARWTTGLSRRTRTTKLMAQNNWLGIKEMTRYHGAVLMWKLVHNSNPKHIYNKLEITEDFKIENPEPRLQITGRSSRHRAS